MLVKNILPGSYFRSSESNSLRSEHEEAVLLFTNPSADFWWKLISFAQNVDSEIDAHYDDLDRQCKASGK